MVYYKHYVINYILQHSNTPHHTPPRTTPPHKHTKHKNVCMYVLIYKDI